MLAHLVVVGVLLQFFPYVCTAADASTTLKHKLFNYALTSLSRARVKRGLRNSSPTGYNRIDEVTFSAFGSDYRLYLTPKLSLLDSKFRAIAENDVARQHKLVPVSPDEFLEGHLYGTLNSRVSAHFDEDGAMTGLLETEGDTLMFEPAWRHVRGVSLNTTLVYRLSDMRQTEKDIHPMCGYVQLDDESPENNTHSDSRPKRQVQSPVLSGRTRCSLKLVADYKFFRDVGDSSTALTTRYLINLIDRVNTIYTRTEWSEVGSGDTYTDLGFTVKEVLIKVAPTPESNHYNMEMDSAWAVDKLLKRFTEVEGSNNYCLVHLFTSQSFAGGVLGLGYIASHRIGTSGGICSAAAQKGNRKFFYNTALSSAKSTHGDTVITREADIVTAHEFGHNWGSPHDPSDTECSPNLKGGGSFIMHTYSVSGYDPNNKYFSPCSKRSIKAVLDAKSYLCFSEPQDRFCGNQRVERGSGPGQDEECDAGILDDEHEDKCCTRDCRFKFNAVCSPANSPCCSSDCQFKQPNRSEPCQKISESQCRQASYCDGRGADCPVAKPLRDGTPCLDNGECQNGVCVPFCQKRGIDKVPCICENVTDSCYRCCRDQGSSHCQPYKRSLEYELKDGMPCIHGSCEGGICKKEVQDLVEHLWNIIDKLDSNTFGAFIKSNLVGTIIILTLIVWIPVACLVHKIDTQQVEERSRDLDWKGGDSMAADGAKVDIEYCAVMEIDYEEVKDFSFRTLRRLRVFDGSEINRDVLGGEPSINWVGASSKYGLVLVANPASQIVAIPAADIHKLVPNKTNIKTEVTDFKHKIVSLPDPSYKLITVLQCNCDGSILCVVCLHSESPFALFFDVRAFDNNFTGDVIPFCEIRLSASSGSKLNDFQWNPAVPGMCAAVCSDGTVTVLEVDINANNKFSIVGNVTLSGILPTCLCWSPKGKQLILGKSDGSLVQLKPNLQQVKTYPTPSSVFNEPVRCANVFWLSTLQFAVVFCASNNPKKLFFALLQTSKTEPPKWTTSDDVCYGFEDDQAWLSPRYMMHCISEWQALICCASCATDTAVLGQKDRTDWKLWTLDDSGRAEVPFANNKPCLLMGVAMDYSSQTPIILDETRTAAPMPVIYFLSSDGVLIPFSALNLAPGAPVLTRAPDTVSLSSVRVGVRKSVAAPAPAAPQRPPEPRPEPTVTVTLPAPKPAAAVSATVAVPEQPKPVKKEPEVSAELLGLRQHIANEMKTFGLELSSLKRDLSLLPQLTVGPREEMVNLAAQATDLMKELDRSLGKEKEGLAQETAAVRQRVMDARLAVDTAKMLLQKRNSPEFLHLMRQRPLDPDQQEKIDDLTKLFKSLELQTSDVEVKLFNWRREQKRQTQAKLLRGAVGIGTTASPQTYDLVNRTLSNMKSIVPQMNGRLQLLRRQVARLESRGLLEQKPEPELTSTPLASRQTSSKHTSAPATAANGTILSPEQNQRLRQALESRVSTPRRTTVPDLPVPKYFFSPRSPTPVEKEQVKQKVADAKKEDKTEEKVPTKSALEKKKQPQVKESVEVKKETQEPIKILPATTIQAKATVAPSAPISFTPSTWAKKESSAPAALSFSKPPVQPTAEVKPTPSKSPETFSFTPAQSSSSTFSFGPGLSSFGQKTSPPKTTAAVKSTSAPVVTALLKTDTVTAPATNAATKPTFAFGAPTKQDTKTATVTAAPAVFGIKALTSSTTPAGSATTAFGMGKQPQETTAFNGLAGKTAESTTAADVSKSSTVSVSPVTSSTFGGFVRKTVEPAPTSIPTPPATAAITPVPSAIPASTAPFSFVTPPKPSTPADNQIAMPAPEETVKSDASENNVVPTAPEVSAGGTPPPEQTPPLASLSTSATVRLPVTPDQSPAGTTTQQTLTSGVTATTTTATPGLTVAHTQVTQSTGMLPIPSSSASNLDMTIDDEMEMAADTAPATAGAGAFSFAVQSSAATAPSSTSVFGGAGGGFLGGLGAKPSADAASKNVFGSGLSFGGGATQTSSLFGGQPSQSFSFAAPAATASAFGGASSFGGGAAQSTFGATGSQAFGASGSPSSGFGAGFGQAASFGGFGAKPTFGSSPTKPQSSPFGGGGATFGSSFGSPAAPATGGFSQFASQSGSPTFGALAASSGPSAFGGSSSFGAPVQSSAFGGGATFGGQSTPPQQGSFSSWR